MIETSGELVWSEVEGAHRVDKVWWCDTGIRGQAFAFWEHDKILACMTERGKVVVHPGYMWDGSSGPTLDGDADPVPSLVHDVAYEAIRRGKLHESARATFDKLYRVMLQERGMTWLRAWHRWCWVRVAGGGSIERNDGSEYTQHHSQ